MDSTTPSVSGTAGKHPIMRWSTVSRHWHTVWSIGKSLGLRRLPILRIVLMSFVRGLCRVGMWVDYLFYPGLRKIQIDHPILLVGSPRTGSTFLHRFLHDQRVGAGLQLWHMIFPSLAVQKMLRPFLSRLRRASPAQDRAQNIHETSLQAIETDDAALFFRFFDGFFLYAFYFAFAEKNYSPYFDPQIRDTTPRDFLWLQRLWKRNLYLQNADRIVAKCFSLGAHLPAFLKLFPDAKIIYLARDPVEQIASSLSLVTSVLDKRYGFWQWPEPLRSRYLQRMYSALVALLYRFTDDMRSGRLLTDRVLVIRYDRLMNDFESTLQKVLSFVEHQADEEIMLAIKAQAGRQKSYRSSHSYTLEKFQLTKEQVQKDCSFFYESFLSS